MDEKVRLEFDINIGLETLYHQEKIIYNVNNIPEMYMLTKTDMKIYVSVVKRKLLQWLNITHQKT